MAGNPLNKKSMILKIFRGSIISDDTHTLMKSDSTERIKYGVLVSEECI